MLVAIETTGNTCGVAFYDDSMQLLELHLQRERAHDQMLAQLVDTGLRLLDLQAEAIDHVAVSIGPGSYTGIRIGMSVATGLSLAIGCDVVAVPTLDAIAYDVIETARLAHRSRVVAVVPAGPLGVHATLYEVNPEFRPMTDTKTVDPGELAALLDENTIAAGPGIGDITRGPDDSILYASRVLTARSIAERALVMIPEGLAQPPEEIKPLYISGAPSRAS